MSRADAKALLRSLSGQQVAAPKLPEEQLELNQPGDPKFEQRAFHSQAQFPAAAAQQLQFQNRARSARLIRDLTELGAENEITPEMLEARDTGRIEKTPSFFERLLTGLDAPRRVVNLALQDIVGGTRESASIDDYIGTLFGYKSSDDIFRDTGLSPESGSQTLQMLGWDTQEGAWGKVARFGGHVALEILTDPLTYITFGGSAVGKKALSAATKGFIDDTMVQVGKGITHTPLESRMLARVNELEKKFLKIGDGAAGELELTLDLGKGAKARARATAKAKEELADEMFVPIITRDFGKLAKDVTAAIPAYMRGGARLYIPLKRVTGMGLEKGLLIPGTQGLGRKANKAFASVVDFVTPSSFKSSAFSQWTLDQLRHLRGTSDPIIHLYDGMKAGRISGAEFMYLTTAETTQQMGQSVAEAIAHTNHMQGKVLAAAAEEGVFADQSLINRTVWRFINDSDDAALLAEFSAHGSQKFATEMIAYRNFVREQWTALVRGMADLDPRVSKLLDKIPTWMPQVMTPGGRKVLTKIAQSGADVQKITQAAIEAGDPGGFFLAALIESMGGGAKIPGNMTTHAGLLQLGGREAANPASIPIVNLVEAQTTDGIDLASRVMMIDPAELSGVPWIAEMQKILKSAEPNVQINSAQLNDFIQNHIKSLAEELNIPIPKDATDGRLFLEDPFEAVVEVTRHLHYSAHQLAIIDMAKKINGVTEIDTFMSMPRTIDNILNRIEPEKLEKALADSVTDLKKNVHGKAKSRAVKKYREWKAKPARRLDDPKYREKMGIDNPSIQETGYHGFYYDAETGKYYWASRQDATHNVALVEMLADWVESGKLEGVAGEALGSWGTTGRALASMPLQERKQLADALIVARKNGLGRSWDLKNPVHYSDEQFNDMIQDLISDGFDADAWVNQLDQLRYSVWDDLGEIEVAQLLNRVAYKQGHVLDPADLRRAAEARDVRQLPLEEQIALDAIRDSVELHALNNGWAARGSFHGRAAGPVGRAMTDIDPGYIRQLEENPGFYALTEAQARNSIQIEAGHEALSEKNLARLQEELNDFGAAKGDVDMVWTGNGPGGVKAIGPPKRVSDQAKHAAGQRGRYELNQRLKNLAEMPPGVERDAEYRALRDIIGADDMERLTDGVKDLEAINDSALRLSELVREIFSELPTRVGRQGTLDLTDVPLQVTPKISRQLEEAREIAEEFGLDKKIINAFVPVEAPRPSRVGFVNPKIFGIAEAELSGFQVKKDVALWFEQLVRNMGSVYQPLAIAQAKETATWLTRIWKTSATITRPTFHMRNMVGGVWNNQIIGVGMTDYLKVNKAAVVVRNKMRKGASLAEALDGISNGKTREMMWAAWESGLMDQSFSRSEFRHLVSKDRRTMADGLRLFNPADPEKFMLAKMGATTMESIEDLLRLAAFNRWYDPKVGNAAQIAKEMAIGVHFDYSALTEFETTIKKFVPFFVWFRRNIPLQMKTMIEQPGIINRYTHLMNAVNEEFGGDHPLDEFGTPDYWTAQAAGTNIVFNEGTPFWARWFFDPDLPVTDLTNLDPFKPQDALDQMTDLLGPWLTLPFDLQKQADFNDVAAPTGLNEILGQLANTGWFNKTEDGDVKISYTMRSMFNTALPWWNEIVGTAFGPSGPDQQARLGEAQGESSLLGRIGQTAAKGVGLKLQVPADTRSQAYGTQDKITDIVNDLKARHIIRPPEDDPEYASRWDGLFSGR